MSEQSLVKAARAAGFAMAADDDMLTPRKPGPIVAPKDVLKPGMVRMSDVAPAPATLFQRALATSMLPGSWAIGKH
jgi:hypothetical protein